MRWPKLLPLAACTLASLPAAYVYDYANLLNPYSSGQWTGNGTYTASNNMFTSSATNGGSLIFGPTVPGTANSYEVRTTLTLASSGGNYYTYLRATSNSLAATGNTGTYYAVQVANPTFSGSSCSTSIYLLQSVSGTISTLATVTGVPCHSGMVVRSLVWDTAIAVFIDNVNYLGYGGPITGTGQPGIGVSSAPAGNGISAVDIGHKDIVAPAAVNAQLIGTSVFPNHVDMQWPGVLDDTNGVGVFQFNLYRNGAWIATLLPNAVSQISDTTVAPSTAYAYVLAVIDFHFNQVTTSFNVTTPPVGSTDPRQVGVRPLGSYWGGGGEQIDLRSGNLNYTIPLLKTVGRGGWGVGFSLSYNSQNWRQDPGGTWQLGRDIGYGYGWKMQAGSLTPVYSGYYNLDHYLFIDSTGAEYRLDQNTGGVWSSKAAIYVYYDSNVGRLYFTNGSFWVFGSTSAGTEQDSGTMYPTLMQDPNGNQIILGYNTGVGVTWTNSSSRINTIEDVRANGAAYDYLFAYNTDNPPHLTGITNYINTAENYSFAYTVSTNLLSPFNGANFGSFKFLQSATSIYVPLTTTFTYDGSGSGELTRVTTPYGGHIGWAHGSATFVGTRTQREVQGRYLSKASGAPETSYGIVRDNPSSLSSHYWMILNDPDGKGQKFWYFQTDPSLFNFGTVVEYGNNVSQGVGQGSHIENYTWTTNASGNPYISIVDTTEDWGNPTAVQKRTAQALDQYGNLTQMQVFNFGNLSTPARTYTNTYLTDDNCNLGHHPCSSNYAARYIFNRLLTSTVTDGVKTTTLVSNQYDYSTLTDLPGIHEHDASFNTTNVFRGNIYSSASPGSGSGVPNYDIGGNPTNPSANGVTTTVTTNSTTNFAAPSAITTITGQQTSMNWNATLNLTSATGPNGDGASIVYDANARPTSTTSPTGAITYFTYDDSTAPYKTASTNSHWTKTSMDGFGRPIKIESGDGSSTKSVIETVYDSCGCSPLGKLTQTSRPHAPGATVYWTTNTYDGLGRTTRVTLPDLTFPNGSHTDYVYQGNTVKVTDPAGKWKKFTLDAFGNLTQVEEFDPALNASVFTTYTYDILNHLTNVSMTRGSTTQTRTFDYLDPATSQPGALLRHATNPENGIVTYTYNSNNTLASKTDAKGQQLTYQYDSYHRLLSVTWANGGPQVLRTYYYDTNPFVSNFSQNSAGRLTAIQHGNLSTVNLAANQIHLVDMYSYTQAGLPAIKRLQVNEALTWQDQFGTGHNQTTTANLDVNYQYNTEGKMTSVTYPTTSAGTGSSYTYSYDTMSRLAGMTDASNSSTVVNNVTYGAANELLTMNYWLNAFTGVSEARTYNTLGQLTNLALNGGQGTTYVYTAGSNNGKISSQKAGTTGEEVQYAYDSLNRLISASTTTASDGNGNTPWGETFSYDGFGNLTAKTLTKGTSPNTPPPLSVAINAYNQIVGAGYDANGNMTATPTIPSTALGYDSENRMTSVGYGATMNYGYDAQNKRFWSWNGSSVESHGNVDAYNVYLYAPGGQKLAAYQITNIISGATATMYSALVTSDRYFGGRRVQAEDRLSSTNGSFYPYGEDKPGNPASDTWKFATYWRDSNTTLDYADQRYYSSQYGRFTVPDPYKASAGPADPKSWNRYSYTRGDPVNRYDPSGLDDESPAVYVSFMSPPSGPGPSPEDPGGGNGLLGGLGFSGDSSMEQLVIQMHGHGGGGARTGTGAGVAATAARVAVAGTKALTALLDPKCAGLFNIGGSDISSPLTLLASILTGSNPSVYFTEEFFAENNVNAKTMPTSYSFQNGMVEATGVADKLVVAFNFNASAPFNTGSVVDNAITILHELGHIYDMGIGLGSTLLVNDSIEVQGSASASAAASAFNTSLIKTNCFPVAH